MNVLEEQFPQEWPDHLSAEVDVGFCDESPPAGHHTLLFEKLNSKQFEQLCWWLLQKDYKLVGCQLVGQNGRKQDGIDLFAFDRFDPEKLVVFQCKCWVDFPCDRLSGAVDAFLAGKWATRAHQFILIVAQPELGKLTDCWPNERRRIRQAGVAPELWNGMDLTQKIQRYPDILTKFFPGAATHAYCNEWMQRVGFMERLQKAQVDPRPEVSKAAKELLGDRPPEEIETRVQSGSNWILKRPLVYLSAMLPNTQFPVGSALINIHQPDVEGVQIVLSQKWLCSHFLGSIGAPLLERYRSFLGGELINSSPRLHIVDLENARFTLPDECISELGYVADELTKVFLNALIDSEQQWGAQYFPFIGTDQVGLCTMPEWLWRTILEFTNDYDIEKGCTNWHMFDAARGALKPYTRHPHPTYNEGYHGIFYARDKTENLVYGDDVLILWSPPVNSNTEIDERKWWSCSYARSWIENELIPRVGIWAESKQKKSLPFAKKNTEFAQRWKDQAKINDIRLWPLERESRYRSLGLVKVVEHLQSFFHGQGAQQRIYLTSEQMRSIYLALIVLLKGERGYPGYIAGNLSLGNSCSTHEEIITQLTLRISEQKISSDSSILDFALRSMLEALNDSDSWLDDGRKNKVFEGLMPLMHFFDQEMLIKRHCDWL